MSSSVQSSSAQTAPAGTPSLVALDEGHVAPLAAFFSRLPEGDRTFIKESVDDAEVVAGWARAATGSRWLAYDGTDVLGYLAVLPLPGWSSHVGELRIVVAPEARGRGLGRMLAGHALSTALQLGLSKLVVEVVAVQTGTIAMFNELGFRGEALLTDHIRDGHGELQDLVVLAHDVTAAATALETVGADE
jgi:ribosomal protein S18 acetylase RimI-like enzyme